MQLNDQDDGENGGNEKFEEQTSFVLLAKTNVFQPKQGVKEFDFITSIMEITCFVKKLSL